MKVLAGGCFNSIHPGHIYFLSKAKSLGSKLIVVLTNDAHNRKPYAINAEKRKALLESLGIADRVVIGSSEDYSAVVRDEKPGIIALGYDQKLMGSTKEVAEIMGIKIIRIEKFGNYSSRLGH